MSIDPERAAQIVNNVAEEFVDQGRTDFATEREFCLAIIWLRGELDKHIDKSNEYRGQLLAIMTDIAASINEEEPAV